MDKIKIMDQIKEDGVHSIQGSFGEIRHYDELVKKREEISEKSSYSSELTAYIREPNELKIYQNADLKEGIVNDRMILKDDSIDLSFKDGLKRSNLERMQSGLSPLTEHGETYNLHHIGQKMDSPLAELSGSEHRLYYKTLHDTSLLKSDIDRGTFDKERSEHWKARAEMLQGAQ